MKIDMNNWHERFKAMKKELGLTNSDIAKITGNTEDSIKSTGSNSNKFGHCDVCKNHVSETIALIIFLL